MVKKIFTVFFAVSLIFVFTVSVSASGPDAHGYYSDFIRPFVMDHPFAVISNTSGDYEPSMLDDYDDLIVLRGGTVNDHLVQPETFGFWILFRILGYTPEQLNHYLDDFVRSALSSHGVDDITELDYDEGDFAIFYCFWRDVGLTVLKRNGSEYGSVPSGPFLGLSGTIYTYDVSLLGFSSDILTITSNYYLEIVSKFFAAGVPMPSHLFDFSAVDDFNDFWQSSDNVVYVKFNFQSYAIGGNAGSYRGVVNLDDSGILITTFYDAPPEGSLSDIIGSILDNLDLSVYVSWLPSSISSIFLSYFGILITLIGILVALKILHG